MNKRNGPVGLRPVLGWWSVVLATAAAGAALHARPARACGGFFCSQSAPVEQSAEEIIFVDNPDDTVTAVIRIEYAGPAEQFAWVLPIEGAPSDVGVSSEQAFAALRNFSDPQFILNTTVEGECQDDGSFGNGPFPAGAPTMGAADAGAVDEDGVGVIAEGSVGPYDWHVINVNPQLDDSAEVAVTWLVNEGYDVTALGPDVLRPYLDDGLNLMAFRLTKGAGADVGSIRPVVITYESEAPAIPIRPTAVAAQDDMGIRVWVLGGAQAVPINYKALVINEALVNWFNFRSTYRAVVTAAADEAGGQGFVTEMAGDTVQLDGQVFTSFDEQRWRSYSLTSFADGFEMIQQASGQYRLWDGFRDAVCAAASLPDGVTCDEFGRNPDAYRATVQIDGETFMLRLYEDVVRPVIRTQELLLSRPYFTRLFNTMSPNEMTLDPVFEFNPDLADISNVRVAEHVVECSAEVTYFEAPWRIELPQGGVIRGTGQQGSWPFSLEDLPATVKIVQLGTSGAGRVVEDNSQRIRDVLFAQSGMMPSGMAEPEPPSRGVPIGGGTSTIDDDPPSGTGSMSDADGSMPSAGGSGLCSVRGAGHFGASRAGWAAVGLAFALWLRRRGV